MSKGTTARNIRVPDDVWQAAKEKAAAEGTTVSDLVQAFLAGYAKKPATPRDKGVTGGSC